MKGYSSALLVGWFIRKEYGGSIKKLEIDLPYEFSNSISVVISKGKITTTNKHYIEVIPSLPRLWSIIYKSQGMQTAYLSIDR